MHNFIFQVRLGCSDGKKFSSSIAKQFGLATLSEGGEWVPDDDDVCVESKFYFKFYKVQFP
jgi:hypothetical protein